MKHSFVPTHKPLFTRFRLASVLAGASLTLIAGVSTAAPPASVLLPRSKIVLPSTIQVDLTRRTARLPLHRGTYNGLTVWYILTDCSDQALATQLGLNFAPKLANIPHDAPAAFQTLKVPANILQASQVRFQGIPDFLPLRSVTPGPNGYPLAGAEPGAIAGPGYSPYVQPAGTNIIYNAPIVAVGTNVFDLWYHTNTHDRVIGIDTKAGTVDVLFIQAFSGGKQVIYLGMDATTPESAALERATFTPGIAESPFPNGAFRTDGARASIFSFANGQLGLDTLNSQGLNHLVIDGMITKDATPTSYDVFDALARGGDARNVVEVFPTMTDPVLRNEYSPAWDFHVSVWRNVFVQNHTNIAQSDAFTIRTRAVNFDITSPGGLELRAAGIEVNCPVIAFINDPPLAPLVPAPYPLPLPYRQ